MTGYQAMHQLSALFQEAHSLTPFWCVNFYQHQSDAFTHQQSARVHPALTPAKPSKYWILN